MTKKINREILLELSSDVNKTVFDNGLTLLVKEFYPASVVCLAVWVKVGSLDENNKQLGISHFVEHMLFKTTKRRKVGQIAQEIHALGGYLNGFTSYDCTCFWVVLPSRFFDVALDVQADSIMNSIFLPRETEKEKKVIIEEMHMYDDKPESYLFDKLMELAYTRHRFRHPVVGYEHSVKNISLRNLLTHYEKFYRASNMMVVVAGNLKIPEVTDKVYKIFGKMSRGVPNQRKLAVEPPQNKMRKLTLKGDIKNAHLVFGFHIPSIFDEEIFALDMLSTILGEGASSRLNVSLREKKRLAFDISAGILTEQYPGIFIVDALMDPGNLKRTEEAIWEEIVRIKEGKISSKELEKAKNMNESSFIFSQEVVQEQARRLGYFELLGDYRLADVYLKNIMEVHKEDIIRSAKKYLNFNNCSIIEYLPKSKQ